MWTSGPGEFKERKRIKKCEISPMTDTRKIAEEVVNQYHFGTQVSERLTDLIASALLAFAEKEREKTIEECAEKVVEYCDGPFSPEDMPHPESIAKAIRSLTQAFKK